MFAAKSAIFLLFACLVRPNLCLWQDRHLLLSQSKHLELVRASMSLFANKTLTVCVVVREPFVMYNEPDPRLKLTNETAHANLSNYYGVGVDIIKRLARIYNFKMRIIRPKDGQFGVLAQDGRWTGLVGTLERRESDVGLTALSIIMSRLAVIDFTRAYYVETVSFLMRMPEEVQNYLAILEPFSSTVWMMLLATIVVLIMLITIMTKLEENQREQQKLHKLAKFLNEHQQYADDTSTSGRNTSDFRFVNAPTPHPTEVGADATADARSEYSRVLEHRLEDVARAHEQQEFGDTWTQRFYYATSCVLNILLIRGE